MYYIDHEINILQFIVHNVINLNYVHLVIAICFREFLHFFDYLFDYGNSVL